MTVLTQLDPPPSPVAPTSRRAARVGWAGLVCVLALYLAWAHYGQPSHDEGHFLFFARRVQLGQVPYRDFFTLYPPTIVFAVARLFDVFGPSILWPRYAVAVVKTAILLLTFLVARTMVPGRWAFAPPLLVLVLDWANDALKGPSPGIFAEGWVMLAWLAILPGGVSASAARRSFLAGSACAVATAFKPSFGLPGTIALLLCLLRRGPGDTPVRFRPLAAPSLQALAAMTALAAPAIFLPVGSGPAKFALLVLPALTAVMLARSGFSSRPAGPAAPPAIPFVWGWCITAFLWASLVAFAIGSGRMIPDLVLQPLAHGGNRFASPFVRSGLMAAAPIFAFYLLSHGLATLSIIRQQTPKVAAASDDEARRGIGGPTISAALAGLLTLSLFPWPTYVNAPWIAPPYAVLAVWSVWVWWGRGRSRRILRAAIGVAVIGAALLAGIRSPFGSRWLPRLGRAAVQSARGDTSWARPEIMRLPLERAPVFEQRQNAGPLLDTVGFIETHTGASEPIFIFNNGAHLYFLTDRPNPTRHDTFAIGMLTRADVADVRSALEQTGVRWIIWLNMNDGDVFGYEDLSDYIRTRYRLFVRYGEYFILLRVAGRP